MVPFRMFSAVLFSPARCSRIVPEIVYLSSLPDPAIVPARASRAAHRGTPGTRSGSLGSPHQQHWTHRRVGETPGPTRSMSASSVSVDSWATGLGTRSIPEVSTQKGDVAQWQSCRHLPRLLQCGKFCDAPWGMTRVTTGKDSPSIPKYDGRLTPHRASRL